MANLVVHFELYGTEPERLVDFYSELLGWSFERFGEMPYWMINTGDESIGLDTPGRGINGGLAQREGPRPEAGAPVNGCNIVVGVEDVDVIFARALELGATQSLAPEDMAGVGRVAYLLDPDGNLLGLISPVLSDGTNAMDG
jgi:hypothetical protein